MSVTSQDRADVARKPHRPALFRSVRVKLVVTFSLLFVVVLAAIESATIWGVPFTGWVGSLKREEARTFRSLGLVADVTKSRLLSAVKGRRDDIRAAVTNDSLRINVARLKAAKRTASSVGLSGMKLISTLRREESYHILADCLKLLVSMHDAHDNALIADAETGTVLVSLDRDDEGTSVAQEPFFIGVLRSQGAFLGDVERCPLVGWSTLCLGRAVEDIELETLDAKSGDVAAVLMLDVNADDIIAPLLRAAKGLGETGEALLVNQKQGIITSLKYRLADGTVPEPLKYEIRAQPAVLAAQGAEGIIEADDYRGESVLAAYRHIQMTPEWGWGLVVKRDVAELYAPLRQHIAESFAIGLVGIFAILGMTVYFAGKLTRPIAALSRTAERVAEGDRAAYAPVIGSDEVARLATTFNSMVHRMHNWHTDLEEQVELRTTELSRTNNKLRAEMTERGQAEEEKRESEKHFRLLVDGVTDYAIFMLDPEGVVVNWNTGAQRIKGYTAQEIVGKHFSRFYLEEDVAAGKPGRDLRVATAEGSFEDESCRVRKDGSRFVANVVITAVRDDSGKLVGFSKVTRDITDRKQTEEELRKRHAELAHSSRLHTVGEMASGMAHELNQPLTAISTHAWTTLERIRLGRFQANKLDQALANIAQQAERANAVVRRTRDFVRKQEPRPSQESINTLVREAVGFVEQETGQYGLPIELRLADRLPNVLVDRMEIHQVVVNLARNGLESMRDSEAFAGGRLTIATYARPDNGIEVAISDQGPGIAPQDHDRIFQSFVTSKADGMGMGLPISRRIVENYGGRLWVKPRHGRGTTLAFSLPASNGSDADEG